MIADYPFIREIRSPLTSEQLRPLDERCRVVQFSRPLADDEYARLAEFIRPYPQVKLRIYGPYGVPADLEFLRHFPFVTRFQSDIYNLMSLDGLRHLPESLEFLGLGQTKSKRYSLSILSRFPELRTLCLEGFTRDIHVIGTLRKLQDLTLRSITLPDLEIFTNLPELRSLDLKLGGTKNLDALARIEHLRYLELWMVKGLTDLNVLTRLNRLQFLFLQALKNVTSLPSLRTLPCLRRVHIETMKALSDLQPVADAPALEELLLIDMGHLSPDAVRPFRNHPHLRWSVVGLGSIRKNELAKQLIGVPAADRAIEFVFQ